MSTDCNFLLSMKIYIAHIENCDRIAFCYLISWLIISQMLYLQWRFNKFCSKRAEVSAVKRTSSLQNVLISV